MTPRLGTDGNGHRIPHSRDSARRTRLLGSHSRGQSRVVAALGVAALRYRAAPRGAGYGLEAPILSVLGDRRCRSRERRKRPDHQDDGALALAVLQCSFAAVLFGPLAAGVVGAASMLGDPELLAPCDQRQRSPTEVGDLHEHSLHRGRCDGSRRAERLSGTSSEFGALVLATLVGAIVGEIMEVCYSPS